MCQKLFVKNQSQHYNVHADCFEVVMVDVKVLDLV